MKNYFNQNEASNHLILMTAMVANQNLINGNSITDAERKMLKKAMKLISDFSESVFDRLGDGYKKSLKNKASLNTIRIVSRNVHHKNNADMEDFIDGDTLREIVNQTADIDCSGCDRKNCKNCGIYKIKSYLHYDGISDDTDSCPFRKEKQDYSFDFLDDNIGENENV